jgi:hypothetical protein
VKVFGAAAWASGNNMNTARYGLAGTGTQTAGLAFGGYTTPNSIYIWSNRRI